ncbi:hypothetical protein CKA38_14120 [Ereboglobus luteus]|uniref:SGNH hydrolase-type esterase domain-containing protein n=2 Tax=Ereboglobus luteus TaxID=1796921 RepID=A0A2U8E7F4_9BACT|nr:hypothetical protein CKA38_14120 [Ereboglobus luteus]
MHWVGTWAASAQKVEAKLMPPSLPELGNVTIRQIVRVSIGGKQMRVRFSNAFAKAGNDLRITAATVAVSNGSHKIKANTLKPLAFQGRSSVAIPAGKLMISDPLDFDLAPGADLTVTIHVEKHVNEVTGHRSARCKSFFQTGDAVAAPSLKSSVNTNTWFYLSGVDVSANENAAAIVCLGDSITDGRGSTEDENRRWPDFLARRLLANPETAHIGVLNQGIGGNTVCRGGKGEPALKRFERDVLLQTGVRWVIVLEGINDLGGGKTDADEIIAAYRRFIALAHKRGMRVFGGTILPCGGSFYAKKPQLEARRQRINDWIRTSGEFDAVIDFDATVRDPKNPDRMLKAADCGDHLHPGDKGYRMMADSIDLSLFK